MVSVESIDKIRVVTRYLVYFFVTDPIFLPKILIPHSKNIENFDP